MLVQYRIQSYRSVVSEAHVKNSTVHRPFVDPVIIRTLSEDSVFELIRVGQLGAFEIRDHDITRRNPRLFTEPCHGDPLTSRDFELGIGTVRVQVGDAHLLGDCDCLGGGHGSIIRRDTVGVNTYSSDRRNAHTKTA